MIALFTTKDGLTTLADCPVDYGGRPLWIVKRVCKYVRPIRKDEIALLAEMDVRTYRRETTDVHVPNFEQLIPHYIEE